MDDPAIHAALGLPYGAEGESVPPEIQAALVANDKLRQALDASGLPTRFSAMVLGLATLRQLRQGRDVYDAATEATSRKNAVGWGVLS